MSFCVSFRSQDGWSPLSIFVDFNLSWAEEVIYKIPFFESFTRIAGGAEKIASLFLMPIFGRRVTKPLYNPFLLLLCIAVWTLQPRIYVYGSKQLLLLKNRVFWTFEKTFASFFSRMSQNWSITYYSPTSLCLVGTLIGACQSVRFETHKITMAPLKLLL